MAFRFATGVRILLCLIASPPMRALPLTLLALVLAACDTASGDSALITAYDGPEITLEDGLIDDALGPRGWWVERDDMPVILTRTEICGDECGRTLTLRFDGEREGLPASIDAGLVQQEYLPERRTEDDIEVDRVEIQDWGPRIYSGVVYPSPAEDAFRAPIVFWAEVGLLID